MKKGIVHVLCGEGSGKSACAIGLAVKAAGRNENIVIIQFLKGRNEENEMSKRLEPEIKVFSFEKSDKPFSELSSEERKEEATNMRNGVNFAKKVLSTRDCDVLILDEILGLVDYGIIEAADIAKLLEAKDDDVDVIMTGIVFPDELYGCVDSISRIDSEDIKKSCC